MLRAVRFAAKLDFTLHPETATPIPELAGMLDGVPAARLFDEVNKLFLGGDGLKTFELLDEYQLLEHLLPETANMLAHDADEFGTKLIKLGLQGTDERVRADKSVTPAFLFAVLLWPAIRGRVERSFPGGLDDPQVLQQVCDTVTAKQQMRVAVPRRFTAPLRELVGLQPRFERRAGRRALRLLEHPRFRAAYDFMLLRAQAGEIDIEIAEWWTHLQTLSEPERETMVESAVPEKGAPTPRRRRRRRGKRPPPAAL
jgi:poly(A) polymerase